MSGFLIAAQPFAEGEWGKRLAFSARAEHETLAIAPWHGVLSFLDGASLRAAAYDELRGLSVIVAGRVPLGARELARANRSPGRGGLASRLFLDYWLESPQAAIAAINGAMCLLVHDARAGMLHLFTDRMGVFPVYACVDGATMIATHPDVLADFATAEGRPMALDLLTMAEMLHRGTATQPHTYYRNIVQLEAATHYVFDLADSGRSPQSEVYWAPPRNFATVPDIDELAESFAVGLKLVGTRREFPPGHNGLLLSGGADSRALLYTATEPSRVVCLTFCDQENPEVVTARAIAESAGAPHRVLARSFEHYGEGASESVRVTGGMWSIKDAHYQQFATEIDALGLSNLMTGCYTDYLYKGLAYNRRQRRLFGKRLSLDELAAYDVEFYQPHSVVADCWQKQVSQRVIASQPANAVADYADDPFAVEDWRIRPLSREADAMGRLYLLRTQPWDPVMIDNELIELYGRIPPRLKLNARVFRAAVSRVLPEAARKIRNNNDYSPIGTREPVRVIRYLWRKSIEIAVGRLRGKNTQESIATSGSWPDFRFYVAHSQLLADLWKRPTSGQRELFADLLGADPFALSLDLWAKRDIDLVLRLLTLKIWLDQRRV